MSTITSPYLGLAHTLRESDERQVLWRKQREELGFDDTELWNLFYTISLFCLPRIKRFRETLSGYPSTLTLEEWSNKLLSMEKAFELLIDDKIIKTAEEQAVIDEGLDNFRKYFENLWN